MEKKNSKDTDGIKSYAKFSGIVIEMLAIIGGGAWLGHRIDQNAAREIPVFTIILSLLAIALALYLVISQVNQHENGEKK
ncbi:MAG: AtpZ/AtpI family protein [Bacteroidales bacterium]|jgi:F0F1-type ATP synthase assembly protein I|nr:AtpZ/AtpI family protein [Bacteroidales bacterium]